MSGPTVVILAGGSGTRMRSATPKLAHDLCGQPLLAWSVNAARAAFAEATPVVVVPPGDIYAAVMPEGVTVAVQQEPLGTADAVAAAEAAIERDATVIVMSGDVPLVEAQLLRELAQTHAAAGAAATMVTVTLEDPSGYGRVVREESGAFVRVVETKTAGDASAAELELREVNAGIYAFAGAALLDALAQVGAENAQGERYLPEVLTVLRGAGETVATHAASDPVIVLGVNDRRDLAALTAHAQQRIQAAHMLAGVTIVAPASTTIEVAVQIGPDTVIEPCTQLRGRTVVGSGCTIGPHSTLIDSSLRDRVSVLHSHLLGAELHEGCSVGPFAYLRPGALLREGAKAGTFVEVKNSDIGAGAKIPHLSYVGDADVGEQTNLGAGSITANYDGVAKHRTKIGARVHGGVDTSFVAPVSVGDDAWTAAGSVITGDVPAGALAVARARQRNVERYGERRGK
ncbi:MAG TPA: bifunctional UDP-N-acetylglucosamine diphosphorylase/glucosamine-1-phosphate N-acetyltransferase GlmU [Solirubrobacteraceae bacterium]|jgi:bifunctional UDP-N-acetylglucosamine pyrophosphorylase/glucosamine-1-phosphate N-acetyltransferase